jgi:ABC-type oligopeptide transport system ATPase subunit
MPSHPDLPRSETAAPVLDVQDVSVVFGLRRGLRREPFRALDGVSLTVEAGRTVGLVGESGSGKTTLLKTIIGMNRPTSGRIVSRGVVLSELSDRERRPLRPDIQIVFQDPYSSLNPTMTVHEIVAEPLRIAGRYSAKAVAEALDLVGLSGAASDRRPRDFSGGQRQRIGIARALALRPSLIVLDEPVSALDVSIQAQILNLLKDLQEATGVAYLFVAHDLSVVRFMSHRIAVMHRGRIVEENAAEDVYARPASDYTRALIDAIPLPDPRRRSVPPRPAPPALHPFIPTKE